MRKAFFIMLFFLAVSYSSFAQYANTGTGSLRNTIWWFNWKGFAITNGASKTFTTDDGLNVTVTFSAVTQQTPLPNIMNTWSGAILHLLYDFTDPTIMPALFNENSTNNSQFTITVVATRNGLPTSFTLVTSDAEASASNEITTFTTTGSNWTTLEFFRNSSQTSNPLTGCNTQTVVMTNTYGGAATTGQIPVLATNAPSATGQLSVTTKMDKSGVFGGMAVAFGIFAPVDRGDLPSSYGYAQHKLNFISNNGCNITTPLPSVTQIQTLKIGAVAGDADGTQTTDDNLSGVDEDGLSTPFPTYNANGSYALTIPVTNTTGTDAYLTGYFDYNRNGVFDFGESVSVTVPNNATNVTLTWSGLPTTFATGSTSNFGFRFRLSSNQLSTQTATGLALDGEVEDYLVPITTSVSVIANFSMPDTVCVNKPVNIANTSSGTTTQYWSFCGSDLSTVSPTTTSFGNPGNLLDIPVSIDYALYNGNYYGFITNNGTTPGLIRVDYGNSLLNTPTFVNLGNFGGNFPRSMQGLQLVNTNGRWYLIVVGGDMNISVQSRVIVFDFGAALTNTSPTLNTWFSLGNMDYPTGLHVFQSGGNWYGIATNAWSGMLTRFSFGANFSTFSATNLGNIGLANIPTGLFPIKDGSNYYIFLSNLGNSTLTRLDFGNSLLNTPTGVNLGNPNGVLNGPRDLHIFRDCNQTIGFLLNASANTLVRLNFATLTSTPSATSLGNPGSFSNPISFSKVFRDGSDIYSFWVNANNSFGRLKFAGCNVGTPLSSTLINPPPVTYSTPGTYTIKLSVDEGLETESGFCKPIVVVPNPVHSATQNISLCSGDSVTLNSNIINATYLWSTGVTTGSIKVKASGTYWVESTTAGGCSVRDSMVVNIVSCTTAIADFTIPDTVCVNAPINIINSSTGASSYYWNFCVASINSTPTGTNLGNVSNQFSLPVFMDIVQEGGNYYGFVTNNVGKLTRVDFGNSLLNNPTAIDLGDFGGVIPNNTEGIQVIKNEGTWYAIIVGGTVSVVGGPRIVKINFGSTITNTSPIATNWGNIGNLSYPVDLHIFQDGANWYGFTVNANGNSFTRFNFGTSFNNVPTGVNLGNIGGLNFPTGICAIKDNTNWFVFVNNQGNSTLTRLDFGTSLLNTPLGINLGSLGNKLQQPRDISIINFCGQLTGFVVNQASNDIVQLAFPTVTSTPTAASLGNIGGFSFPHSISKLFRIGADLYSFVTNVNNNTLTRLKYTGCTNSSIPNSTLQTPPTISYNTPGIYNINLMMDEGLATQTSLCKSVVVTNLLHTPTQNIALCAGDSATISSNITNATYLWSTGETGSSIKIKTGGTYWVESTKFGGCTVRDSMVCTIKAVPSVYAGNDTFICGSDSVLLNATGIGSFSWAPTAGLSNPLISNPKASPAIATDYIVTLTSANGCSAKDTVRVNALGAGSKADFTYTRNSCSPNSIQYFSASTAATYSWDFGNSTTNTVSPSPVVTYANYGTYTVKLKVQASNGCTDSVTKNISIDLLQDNNLIATNDLSVCIGNSVSLNIPDTGLNHCWSPVTGISNPNSATPTIAPTATTTYYFTSQTLGNNLVVNGNFSAGNTGFVSSYTYSTSGIPAGVYYVGTSPYPWHPAMPPCIDHTSGSGNMLLVNGAQQINIPVWSQTIAVTPNTNYAFASWVETITTVNPALLQFSINGITIGNIFQANNSFCIWDKFYAQWNSGTNTSATISIVNMNQGFSGNDFALDDISFSPVIMKQDSIKVTVTPKPVIAASALANTICESDSAQLNASGATYFAWTPITGLSDPTIANPKASPSTTTTYTASGFDVAGCNGTNTVTVTIKPKPIITKSADANICKDSMVQISAVASNVASYAWLPATGLSNAAIYNPLANPTATTNYIVTIDGTNGCSAKDSVLVTVFVKPTVHTRLDTTVCNKTPVVFTTNSTDANVITWLPATGLSDATIPNPIATPSLPTQYIVTAVNGVCSAKDTINLGILPLPSIVKSIDTIICKTGTANLMASGGASYSWLPVYALSNPSSPTPIATPDNTIKYFVTVTGANTCTAIDSIQVTVNPKPVFSLQPITASICKGDSILLTASGGDIYRWVPAVNISAPNAAVTKVYPSIATLYKVGITSTSCKITDTLSSLISLNSSLATFVAKTNDIDCSHGQATLHAVGGTKYEWAVAPGITDLTSANPTVAPLQTTTYYVKIIDGRGCTGYDSIKVNVDFTAGISQYQIPSAFTPNGDGKNDCFGLKYWGAVTQLDFSVYSRWGQVIFHTTNPNDCWDGKLNGQTQDSGTYVYQIKAKTACGDVYRKGTIVLIR